MRNNFVILAFILSGCTVGPVYQEPEDKTPCTWNSEFPTTFNNSTPEGVIWWERLQDPILNELMACAAAENLDLKIAGMRVLKARSEATSKKADLYPHIDGSANCGHVLFSKNALVDGLFGKACPDYSGKFVKDLNFYEVGFDVEWEIDFFGLTAHEIAALKAHEEAVQDNLCGVWVTLSAEVAKNYIELRGYQQRLLIADQNIGAETVSLTLSQELAERQFINDSDLTDAQARLLALKAELPLIRLNIARAINSISILLGKPPEEFFECLSSAANLPLMPSEISIGIPSELLRRRPDIRKAERELAAATERIGSAIASLFPRFSLRGFIGELSTHAGSIFSPSSATWLAGPQVLVPIFNSRLLLQDVDYNKIETREALYSYQKTVLEALEETENAIASYRHEEERLGYLKEVHQRYKTGYELASVLYERGVNDNFAVIKTKKSYLAAEDLMIQSQVDLLLDYVSLYKALGGSWDESL